MRGSEISVLVLLVAAPTAAFAQPSQSFPPAPPAPAASSASGAPAYGEPPPAAVAPAPPPSSGAYQQQLGPYQRRVTEDRPAVETERAGFERGESPTKHNHDGLYIRFAGGIGAMRDGLTGDGAKIASQSSDPSATTFDGAATGFATTTEVAIGATPLPGFVMGVGVYTANVASPEASGVAGFGNYAFAITQLELFAPFADFYVNPHGGLHFQAGAGFAALVMGQGQAPVQGYETRAYTATGFGVMFGGGYEWWVGDDWGVGVLGRALYAWVGATDDDNIQWTHGTLGWSLMLSATYH